VPSPAKPVLQLPAEEPTKIASFGDEAPVAESKVKTQRYQPFPASTIDVDTAPLDETTVPVETLNCAFLNVPAKSLIEMATKLYPAGFAYTEYV
jgi:hypothetical protein